MVPFMLFQSTPKSPCYTESCGHPGADFKLQTSHVTRQKGYMVQLQNHRLQRQCRWYRWFSSYTLCQNNGSDGGGRRLFNCAESVGKLCFLFSRQRSKFCWLWIYFVAKIPTFHSFTVLAPNLAKVLGHAILVSRNRLFFRVSAQIASDVQGFLPSVRWWFRIRRFKTWVGTRVWTLWSPKERVGGKEPTRWENLYSSQIVLFVVPSSERVTVWCRYLKKYCFFVPFFKFKIYVFRYHFSLCVNFCTSVTVHWGSVTKFGCWSFDLLDQKFGKCSLPIEKWFLLGQGECRITSHFI